MKTQIVRIPTRLVRRLPTGALEKRWPGILRKIGEKSLPTLRRAIPKRTGKAAQRLGFKVVGEELHFFAPGYLKFTLPPGTRAHFIPGPATSRAQASAIQMMRGYPMSFYWPKLGRRVWFWSVRHPGYKGDPWLSRVMPRIASSARVVIGIEFIKIIVRGWFGR